MMFKQFTFKIPIEICVLAEIPQYLLIANSLMFCLIIHCVKEKHPDGSNLTSGFLCFLLSLEKM